MSRVYEALKRAENQQPADSVGKRASAQNPAITRTPWPDGTLPHPESALPKLESALPASAAQVRGPALVVGRSEHQYRKVVEQFHLLAVGLQNWSEEHDKRVFMLTSALSGEGKSFMALNLAASLARIGNRVVLVDADLRSPTLHRAFNLMLMPGLVSYLASETEFQACLQTTQIPGLFLVPAGGTSYTPTETLARPRMREFVRELRGMVPQHYVVVDAPAAAAVPESQILNRMIDALMVVVAANRTPRALVKQTIEKAAGTPIYGIVLNRFELFHSSAGAYYPEKYNL
jgi:capsular exopolysaccharide synthesis family protein